jgi:carboxylesterase type B
MRARPVLIAVIALIGVAGSAFSVVQPVGAAVPARYRDGVFPTVVKTSDLVYGAATNAEKHKVTLKFDLYTPPATDTVTSRPAIVWVHGGGFSGGDKTSPELVDEANTFAKKGFVNISINYRLEPGGCSAAHATTTCVVAIKEATQDAQMAVRYLRTHATKYGVDPQRIAIGGSSAGAITAAQVGYATSENPASGVRAALSLSGANLFSKISKGDAAALFFHGTADPLVPYKWAVATVKEAKAKGLVAGLVTWKGAGHVPYVQFRTQILTLSTSFLYKNMDLAHAAH